LLFIRLDDCQSQKVPIFSAFPRRQAGKEPAVFLGQTAVNPLATQGFGQDIEGVGFDLEMLNPGLERLAEKGRGKLVGGGGEAAATGEL
jgi:hypothetical protein